MYPGTDFLFFLPELILLGASLSLLLYGVFREETADPRITRLAVLFMAVSLVFVFAIDVGAKNIFDDLLIVDKFGQFMKILILIGAILTLIMGHGFRKRERLMNFEYPVLVILAALGMLLMVSANDLMSLYLGLELQSLSLYIMAAIDRDSQRSSEAGLKYFVLGALSSGLLLYGCSK